MLIRPIIKRVERLLPSWVLNPMTLYVLMRKTKHVSKGSLNLVYHILNEVFLKLLEIVSLFNV